MSLGITGCTAKNSSLKGTILEGTFVITDEYGDKYIVTNDIRDISIDCKGTHYVDVISNTIYHKETEESAECSEKGYMSIKIEKEERISKYLEPKDLGKDRLIKNDIIKVLNKISNKKEPISENNTKVLSRNYK